MNDFALQPLMTSARTGTGSDRWMTPLPLVRAIEEHLGLYIGDDVAAEPESCVVNRLGRESAWTPVAPGVEPLRRPGVWNGLLGPWSFGDRHSLDAVWCNPPYSTNAEWMAKCAEEGRRRWVVALVPARTDTAWWHEHVEPHAKVVLFLRGRVQFERPADEQAGAGSGQSSTFPSAVILWHPGGYRGRIREGWDWRGAGVLDEGQEVLL